MTFLTRSLFLSLTCLNIVVWFLIGKWKNYSLQSQCIETIEETFEQSCYQHQSSSLAAAAAATTATAHESICGTRIIGELPRFRPLLTKGFIRYKADSLVNIRYPEWSILLQPTNTKKCDIIVHPHASRKRKYSCLAVVTVNSDSTYNLLRFDQNQLDDPISVTSSSTTSAISAPAAAAPAATTALLNVTGFFSNVANNNGRRKLSEKLGKLLSGLSSLESYLLKLLAQRSLYPGQADVAVMVVNDGEIDLFANFACSCYIHNISMNNVLVFAGSKEIIPLIESMGAIGLYHEETFASVSRNASYEYLDPIFIDMMWYKAFSVWLLLKNHFNVLFQDVDLIWYRDPIKYFYYASKKKNKIIKKNKKIHNNKIEEMIIKSVHHDSWGNQLLSLPPADAYLSDDGQRSLRYTPFFANSGFYYLISNKKTINFAWGIIIAFDLLHRTGSHQNVFTIRLIESLDLSNLKPKLLSLREFPAGVKFHHDKPYMRAIKDGHEHPFVFHMCWTRNKYDKLRYFREASMWFVREDVSIQLGELGRLHNNLGAEALRHDALLYHMKGISISKRWEEMSKRICIVPSRS